MKINVGSENKTKVQAVIDTVKLYPNLFPHPQVKGINVAVPEFGHPKSLDETITGAIERAKKAFQNCAYSFGIEGGVTKVPYTKTGYMETGACAIFDGEKIFLGLSPAFEWPSKVTKLILAGKADASKAFKLLGLTEHEKLGTVKGGIIAMLTDNKITRETFTQSSIIMALIQLDKPEFYK